MVAEVQGFDKTQSKIKEMKAYDKQVKKTRKQTTETRNTLSTVGAWVGAGANAQARGADRGGFFVFWT